MTKKIAFFLPNLIRGGAEMYVLRLAEALAARGHNIDIVLTRAQGGLLEEAKRHFTVHDLGAKRTLAAIKPLMAYLKAAKPDILISSLTYPNFAALLAVKFTGLPIHTIAIEHSLVFRNLQVAGLIKQITEAPLMRLIYPWADQVVAVSKAVADDLARMMGRAGHSFYIAANPVLTPDVATRILMPPAHTWANDGKPFILAAGRFEAQKGFMLLLKAFNELRGTQDVRLLLLGDGPQRAELERYIAENGLKDHVAMPGMVENIFPYLKRASLFAMGSAWEAFGFVLVEALACGTKIVATANGGAEEILENGRFGRIVHDHTPQAVAQAMREELAARRDPAPLIERAKRYTAEASACFYENLFTTKKTSVIIPAYNVGAYIREAVESALQAQSVDEVIVVNDGSTDSTADVLVRLQHPKLRIITTPNRGVSAARNAGAAQAAGDYILFLDGDDVLLPQAIPALARALERVPSCVCAYGRVRRMDEQGVRLPASLKLRRPSGDVLPTLLARNFITTTGVALVRRAAFAQSGGFDESLPLAQDWEFWTRLAGAGPFAYAPAHAVKYRQRQSSATHAGDQRLAREELAIEKIFSNPALQKRFSLVQITRAKAKARAHIRINFAVRDIGQHRYANAFALLGAALATSPFMAPRAFIRCFLAFCRAA